MEYSVERNIYKNITRNLLGFLGNRRRRFARAKSTQSQRPRPTAHLVGGARRGGEPPLLRSKISDVIGYDDAYWCLITLVHTYIYIYIIILYESLLYYWCCRFNGILFWTSHELWLMLNPSCPWNRQTTMEVMQTWVVLCGGWFLHVSVNNLQHFQPTCSYLMLPLIPGSKNMSKTGLSITRCDD